MITRIESRSCRIVRRFSAESKTEIARAKLDQCYKYEEKRASLN